MFTIENGFSFLWWGEEGEDRKEGEEASFVVNPPGAPATRCFDSHPM